MFYVGQQVVCIADYSNLAQQDWARLLGLTFPHLNGIYTIRKLVQRAVGGDTAYGLLLHEIVNDPCLVDRAGLGGVMDPTDPRLSKDADEVAFNSIDFRPLITVDDFVTRDERLPEAV